MPFSLIDGLTKLLCSATYASDAYTSILATILAVCLILTTSSAIVFLIRQNLSYSIAESFSSAPRSLTKPDPKAFSHKREENLIANFGSLKEYKASPLNLWDLTKKATDEKIDLPDFYFACGNKDEIAYDDFAKCQFAIGEILKCEEVPKSKKLLCSQVKIGDQTRQILSGIKAYYKPEEMVGKKVMVLLNLAPRSIAGLMSEGMLLCAEGPDGTLALMTPEKDVASGSEIC